MVCVVDILSLDTENEAIMNILGQAASVLGTTSSLPLLKNLWARGGEGLVMFHSVDDKFSVCVASPVRTEETIYQEESVVKEKGTISGKDRESGRERERGKSAEFFNPLRYVFISNFTCILLHFIMYLTSLYSLLLFISI